MAGGADDSGSQKIRFAWRLRKSASPRGVEARAGNIRVSVDLLRKLPAQPSGITVPVRRHHPDWGNLRNDLEFKAPLADPTNSAPL